MASSTEVACSYGKQVQDILSKSLEHHPSFIIRNDRDRRSGSSNFPFSMLSNIPILIFECKFTNYSLVLCCKLLQKCGEEMQHVSVLANRKSRRANDTKKDYTVVKIIYTTY